MRKTIALTLSLLLLTATLAGCSRRGNVSDDENGKITENTSLTESVMPTTTHKTPESNSTTATTHRETTTHTAATEHSTTDSTEKESVSQNETITDETTEETTSQNNGRGRMIGGNGRF